MVGLLQEFPCYNCICVPICRHKQFHELYFDCKLLFHKNMPDEDTLMYLKLQHILKPTQWHVKGDNIQAVISNDGEYDYG